MMLILQFIVDLEWVGGDVFRIDRVETVALWIRAGFGGVPVSGLDAECRTSTEMAQVETNKYIRKSAQNEHS